MATLHIVIPIYNEGPTLETCLRRVAAVDLPRGWSRALYLVDDHSDPPHEREIREYAEQFRERGLTVALHRHEVNKGKGAALQTGFDMVLREDPPEDDIVIIQDADLEYDPDDYPKLIEPILAGRAQFVVGTRWGNHYRADGLKRRVHVLGNTLLTKASNVMTGYRVSDMECCYKLMTISLLRQLRPMLTEKRFGIEPQMIASLARINGARTALEEVPVRYSPRGLMDGKKIGWRDGVRAVVVIVRERLNVPPLSRT